MVFGAKLRCGLVLVSLTRQVGEREKRKKKKGFVFLSEYQNMASQSQLYGQSAPLRTSHGGIVEEGGQRRENVQMHVPPVHC